MSDSKTSSEVRDRVLGALADMRDTPPEEGETWESWFYAAFDLAADKIGRLLDGGASQ